MARPPRGEAARDKRKETRPGTFALGLNLVCESVTYCDAPDDAALDTCRALGKALAE